MSMCQKKIAMSLKKNTLNMAKLCVFVEKIVSHGNYYDHGNYKRFVLDTCQL